ncbi:M23 family metallopeptidase [bacterium]|nr:M23 family metallopeptidase [bacterium]
MLDERFRLMYLSKEKADISQISLTGKKFVILAAIISLCFVLIIGTGVFVFQKVTTNFKIAALENDKAYLQHQLMNMKETVAKINEQMAKVEYSGDQLRDFAGIPRIDNDTRQLGVGGSAYIGSPEIGYYSKEIKKTADEMNADLDRLLRSVRYEKHSLLNVSSAVTRNKTKAEHLPSIIPVMGGYIDDKFGFRIHPIYGKKRFHYGIDVPGPVGTQVLATGAGFIGKISYSNTWGNYIEVNHGSNLITRYCHLSKVMVKRGQKVIRWDKVGEIGQSGRTTGPHLHYEVALNGQRIDPEKYIITR